MTSRQPAALPLPATAPPPLWQLRARWRHWWESRLVPADVITLVQNRIYVLPSRPGLMLAATLAVLLATSINYQLNLGYLLTFMLAGCAAVGLYAGHSTLRGLSLHLLVPEAPFAGTPPVLGLPLIHICSCRRKAKLRIRWLHSPYKHQHNTLWCKLSLSDC